VVPFDILGTLVLARLIEVATWLTRKQRRRGRYVHGRCRHHASMVDFFDALAPPLVISRAV
jgi:hypothetical protein